MSEKMRGALFSALGDLDGLRILDAFAGSGALGFEAISRGADFVQFIETDPKAYQVCLENSVSLGIADRCSITKAYAGSWSTRHQDELFDVVLIDPPYDNLPFRDLKRMSRHVKEGGLLVLSWPSKADWYPFEGLELLQSRPHGDGTLHFYKKITE